MRKQSLLTSRLHLRLVGSPAACVISCTPCCGLRTPLSPGRACPVSTGVVRRHGDAGRPQIPRSCARPCRSHAGRRPEPRRPRQDPDPAPSTILPSVVRAGRWRGAGWGRHAHTSLRHRERLGRQVSAHWEAWRLGAYRCTVSQKLKWHAAPRYGRERRWISRPLRRLVVRMRRHGAVRSPPNSADGPKGLAQSPVKECLDPGIVIGHSARLLPF